MRARFISLAFLAVFLIAGVPATADVVLEKEIEPAPELNRFLTDPEPGWWVLGFDARRFLGIVSVGAGLAILAHEEEDPDATLDWIQGSEWLKNYSDVGNIYGGGWIVGGGSAAVLTAGKLTGNQKTIDLGSDLVRSFLFSALCTFPIKASVNRQRPSGGPWSFPSGHTTSAFSTLPPLYYHLGWKVGVPVTALAVGTALGRMGHYKHFLSDVLFGAAVGLAVGDAVTQNRLARLAADHLVVVPDGVGVKFDF